MATFVEALLPIRLSHRQNAPASLFAFKFNRHRFHKHYKMIFVKGNMLEIENCATFIMTLKYNLTGLFVIM